MWYHVGEGNAIFCHTALTKNNFLLFPFLLAADENVPKTTEASGAATTRSFNQKNQSF